MKKLVILILLILICIIYFWNRTKLVSNDVVTKTGLDKNIIEKNKKRGTKVTKNTAKKPYERLSFDEKAEIYVNCNDYFHALDNGLDLVEIYYDTYNKTHKNKSPSKQQLSALNQRIQKCSRMADFDNKLKNDYISNPFIDKETGKYLYYLELGNLLINEGDDIAIKTAKNNLFNTHSQKRLAALQFLMESDEISFISEENDIPELEGFENSGLFSLAFQLRECELGLQNCSSSSFTALGNCQRNSESCGMDIRGIIFYSLTGYEVSYVEKYLQYLRTINN